MDKKEVILVLSTGGARGLAHIGVIEELERQGFKITSVIGSSMGALVGAMFATGTMQECKEWFCSLNKRKIFGLADFTLSKEGIIKGDRILQTLSELIPDRNIEDLPIPYTAVATDVQTEQEVVFDSGSLHHAIRASISIPMLFRPLKIGDKTLIDGGIANPLPLNRAKRTNGSIIIAVNVNAPNNPHQEVNHIKTNLYTLLTESSRIMQQQITRFSIERYQPELIIEIPGQSYDMLDFHKAPQIIETGREAAKFHVQSSSSVRPAR
ncbi:patatin-like phospholipase family protein [Bacteroides sp.]